MAKAITEELYNDVKSGRKTNAVKALSKTSVARITKSKNYAEFKAILVKDRGPGYASRHGRVEPSNTSTTAPTTPKRKWWEKLLNV